MQEAKLVKAAVRYLKGNMAPLESGSLKNQGNIYYQGSSSWSLAAKSTAQKLPPRELSRDTCEAVVQRLSLTSACRERHSSNFGVKSFHMSKTSALFHKLEIGPVARLPRLSATVREHVSITGWQLVGLTQHQRINITIRNISACLHVCVTAFHNTQETSMTPCKLVGVATP